MLVMILQMLVVTATVFNLQINVIHVMMVHWVSWWGIAWLDTTC